MKEIWSKILAKYPEANFLQSPEWAKVNELVGHKPLIEHDELRWWCLMIVKNAKRGRYLEVPGGPLVDWQDRSAVSAVFQKIQDVARAENCVFVRLRPQLRIEQQELLSGLNLRKAPMHLHAEHTVILDLTKSEDELLAEMRRQTRYDVRRSAKLGMTVTYDNTPELFAEFHQVQTQTATRQHFYAPDLTMLEAERTAFGDDARIYVAKSDADEPVAYGLFLINGSEADYFEAASTDLHLKLPGAYALQWQAIRDFKAMGLQRYNLWGIAPPGQPEHRYAKVTTFKKGFGGEVVEFIPAQDLVIKPGRYQINLLIETIRRKVRKL